MNRIKITTLGLLLAFGTLGCGKSHSTKSYTVSNNVPETEEFYNEFMTLANPGTIDSLGTKVSLNIDMNETLKSNIYANCERTETVNNATNTKAAETLYDMKISINPTLWDTINKNTKRLIIYHELGHCILKREHDDSKVSSTSGTIDKSIMNTYNKGPSIFIKYKTYYDNELFNTNTPFNEDSTVEHQKISQSDDVENQEDGLPDKSIIID